MMSFRFSFLAPSFFRSFPLTFLFHRGWKFVKERIGFSLLVFLLIFAPRCVSPVGHANKQEEVEEPYQLLADETGATPEKVQLVVNANNQFALELFKKYANDEWYQDKIFSSPFIYSISSALAIAEV